MSFLELDYRAVGLRVKMLRIKKEFTQEYIAEKTGLSSPHISNVETGNTKVSLPTLISIANVLECSMDELLCDSIKFAHHVYESEIKDILEDCNTAEIRLIADIVKVIKQSARQRFMSHKYLHDHTNE